MGWPELLRSAQADHLLTAFGAANGSSDSTGGTHGVRLCSSSSLTTLESGVEE